MEIKAKEKAPPQNKWWYVKKGQTFRLINQSTDVWLCCPGEEGDNDGAVNLRTGDMLPRTRAAEPVEIINGYFQEE
jgi:hypothetical protein